MLNTDVRHKARLSSYEATAHQIWTDIRLLVSKKKIEEAFEQYQIESSAMAQGDHDH